MKRTPLRRKTPLRAKPRHEPTIEREPRPFARPTIKPLHRGTYSGGVTGASVEKENAVQHEGYMRLVRAMPCAHCGKPGPSQFCHADMGKGAGIKTDCRRGFPGCADCHGLLGASGKIPRTQRRELERLYGERTRTAVWESGNWPRRLPRWEN